MNVMNVEVDWLHHRRMFGNCRLVKLINVRTFDRAGEGLTGCAFSGRLVALVKQPGDTEKF